MKNRILLIFFGFFVVWLGVIIKAAIVQVFPNENLAKLEKNKFNRSIVLSARRGAIFDKNGRELAVTIPAYSLYADPKLIKNPRYAAKKLEKKFKTSFQHFYKKIKNNKKRFVWIQRRLSKKEKDEVSGWKIKGLAFIEEAKRVYPSNHVLSQLIGFVGSDDQGLEGLELKYEKYLKGENKKVQFQRDARGRPLLINGQVFTDQPDGKSIHLTIDYDLQHKLEKELYRAIQEFNADSAVGVVLDVQDSSVLAMANLPTFNPNYASLFSLQIKRNRAVIDAFEPGSTLKSFVIAGALAKGLYKPSDEIDCGDGKFQVDGKWIREASKKHKFKKLSMGEILSKSSNVGIAKIALKMGDKLLRKTLLDFGFGYKTNIDFPGESRGILQKLPWKDHLLSNISFGHGITATPLQIALAYAAIANGGLLKKPYIVNSIQPAKASLNLVKKKENTVRRVLTKEQSDIMRLMLLEAASSRGTGYNAQVHGYPVAGKTGTAQKVKRHVSGYVKGAYISSFAGFIPANNPRFVIYIAVDNPRKKYYGSEVAAPVFSKVASFAVLKFELPPVILSDINLINFKEDRAPSSAVESRGSFGKKGLMPNFIGMTLREVMRRVKGKDITIKASGSGVVRKTWPQSGERIAENRVIKLNLQ